VKTNELENIKMGNKQSTTVTKCGLSPDETKELITSRVNELVQRHVGFIQVDVLIPMLQAIKERKDNVIRNLSYAIKEDGYMDQRRVSNKVWLDLGIITSPNNPNEYPSPKKVYDGGLYNNGDYKAYLCTLEKQSQKELFGKLFADGKLDNDVDDDGYLVKQDGTKFSNEELCNALDEAAVKFAKQFFVDLTAIDSGVTESTEQMKKLDEMIILCLTTTISRIALAILHPDDIFSEDGHKKWKKHLKLVASFAALTIALDLFGGKSSIPDNIVRFQFNQ
jgi:hypothetical protein